MPNNKPADSCSNRLKTAISARNVKAADIAKATGISKPRISQYMSGLYEPKSKAIFLLSEYLNVSEAWLMGFDVPMERTEVSEKLVNNDAELTEYLEQLKSRKEMRMLFSLAKDATKADVEKAVKVIEALFDKKD